MCLQIFMLDHQSEGRGGAPIDAWREDLQWASRLDYGWDLEKVKQVNPSLLPCKEHRSMHRFYQLDSLAILQKAWQRRGKEDGHFLSIWVWLSPGKTQYCITVSSLPEFHHIEG